MLCMSNMLLFDYIAAPFAICIFAILHLLALPDGCSFCCPCFLSSYYLCLLSFFLSLLAVFLRSLLAVLLRCGCSSAVSFVCPSSILAGSKTCQSRGWSAILVRRCYVRLTRWIDYRSCSGFYLSRYVTQENIMKTWNITVAPFRVVFN